MLQACAVGGGPVSQGKDRFVNKQFMASLWKAVTEFASRHSQFLVNFCKYGLGLGLLVWVIWNNWNGIADALSRPLQFTPLVLGIFVYLSAVLLTFVRWYVLVRARDL